MLARGGDIVGRHALALLLAAGMLLRFAVAYLVFPGQGFRGDLELHERWLLAMADFGPGGFYENVKQALPPVFSWFLWPFGSLARQLIANGMAPATALWATVKLPAMLTDGVVGWLLYQAAKRWSGRRAGLLAAGLFLFIPVTWYESALWGQIDVIGCLFVLVAFIALDIGWSEAAAAASVVGVLVKPQFGIALAVVALVLVRRHLLAPGSGPAPGFAPRFGWLARSRVGRWIVEHQGPVRLVSSALVALLVGLAIVLPFDVATRAPADLGRVPLIGVIAGLVRLVGDQANVDPVIVANAYTPWALVGPDALPIAGVMHWQYDSLIVFAGVTAFQLGIVLIVAAFAAAGGYLLWREDRARDLAILVFLAVALFLLPTRIHERYVYAAFVVGAPFAAVSWRWRGWYIVLGLATLVNLHAVLVHGGTGGAEALPFGIAAQSASVIRAVAVTQGALGIGVLALVFAGIGAGRLGAGRTLAAQPEEGGSSP